MSVHGAYAQIELEVDVNPRTVEDAYRRGMSAIRQRNQAYAQKGERAARARDPRLLLGLERGAEVLAKMAENQFGRTRRTTEYDGYKVELTEAAMWRKAYEFADKGEPLYQLRWIYGMAADLVGY